MISFAYLNVVIHGQVADGVRVLNAVLGEVLERVCERPLNSRPAHELIEQQTVLEAGVHALPVERHHSVRRVAQQDGLVGHVVRLALEIYTL